VITDIKGVKNWVLDVAAWVETFGAEERELERSQVLDWAYLKDTEFVPVLLYDGVSAKWSGDNLKLTM
jgi:hypothetical protein